MSGRRAKALRRAFIAMHGRPPEPAQMTKGPAWGLKGWRDVVKTSPSRFKGGKVVEMFVRKIFSVTVAQPSEWRRWKKDRLRASQRHVLVK